jgi:hypothetical protein
VLPDREALSIHPFNLARRLESGLLLTRSLGIILLQQLVVTLYDHTGSRCEPWHYGWQQPVKRLPMRIWCGRGEIVSERKPPRTSHRFLLSSPGRLHPPIQLPTFAKKYKYRYTELDQVVPLHVQLLAGLGPDVVIKLPDMAMLLSSTSSTTLVSPHSSAINSRTCPLFFSSMHIADCRPRHFN